MTSALTPTARSGHRPRAERCSRAGSDNVHAETARGGRPYLTPVPDCEPPFDDERSAVSRLRQLRVTARSALLVRTVPDTVKDPAVPGWSQDADVGVRRTATASLPAATRSGPVLARARTGRGAVGATTALAAQGALRTRCLRRPASTTRGARRARTPAESPGVRAATALPRSASCSDAATESRMASGSRASTADGESPRCRPDDHRPGLRILRARPSQSGPRDHWIRRRPDARGTACISCRIRTDTGRSGPAPHWLLA